MIDSKPDMKAAAVPTTRGNMPMSRGVALCARSTPSSRAEPIIMGIDNKNEKLAAVVLSTP